MHHGNEVLVGIDGEGGGRTAMAYGAREASRLGVGLRLIHVWPEARPMLGTAWAAYPGIAADSERYGERLLEEHAQLARTLAPEIAVSTSLIRGNRVASLVAAADDAQLTVLGNARRPLLDRLVVGSVLAGVTGRASSPVVVVPDGWGSHEVREGVFAGVRSGAGAAAFVRAAMRIAAGRQLPLTLVHAWHFPQFYDDIIADRVGDECWERAAEAELTALVDSARHDVADDVEVRIEIRHSQPARALLDAAARADLLLLARPTHGLPVAYLGSTARAVLREALAPVEVVPAAVGETDLEGLVLEADGAMLKSAEGPRTDVSV